MNTEQTPKASDVLIIGAGPTGLALALFLTRMDVRVRIIDKTDAPGTTSRATVLHARTLEFYNQVRRTSRSACSSPRWRNSASRWSDKPSSSRSNSSTPV